MAHSKRPNHHTQEVELNLDHATIDKIIASLEHVKSIPSDTVICKAGEFGIKDSIKKMADKALDMEIFVEYYIDHIEGVDK